MKKISRLFIFSILITSNLYGQSIRFSHAEMLKPDNNRIISEIFQDSRGFLWMGGWNTGLIRYDGYSFIFYKNSPNDTSSISNNSITAIIETSDGNLLIGTNNGLNKYNYSEDIFIKYFYDNDKVQTISDNSIRCILLDSKSRIWIGTEKGGLNLFYNKKGIFKHFLHEPGNPHSLSSNNVSALVESNTDTLWVSVFEGGINRFFVVKESFEKYFSTEWGHENYLNLNIQVMCKTKSGDLWLGTQSNGLLKFRPSSNRLKNVFKDTELWNNPKYSSILSLAIDNNENLWIGTYRGGLVMMNPDEKINHFYPKQSNNSISDWLVGGLYQDRDNTLLIGQWGSNLDMQYYVSPNFKNIIPFPDKKEEIDDFANVVSSVFKDSDNDLWVGMLKEGLLFYKNEDYSNRIQYKPIWKKNSLWGEKVTSICETSNKKIWIGTIAGGLNCLDKNTGRFSHYMFNGQDKNSLSDNNVTSIIVANDSLLWIGTANGLNRLNYKTHKFDWFFHNYNDSLSLSDNYITALYLNNEVLWVGTKGGLNEQIGENKYNRILHSQINYNSISNNYITSIISDKENNIWIGTSKGLNRYYQQKNIFDKYHKVDGMFSDAIQTVMIDSSGNIWVGTDEDLVRINPETRRIRTYGDDDNLRYGNLQRCSFIDAQGKMYLGSNIGFYKFSPYNIHENDIPPKIGITSFKKIFLNEMGKEDLRKVNIFKSDRIRLKSSENSFEISFSTFCYKQIQKCQYMFKMKGIADEWVKRNNLNYIRFKDLPSGRYVFEVKGTNNDNFWSKESAKLYIRIKPVFWKSSWFIIIITILIILPFIYFFIKRRSYFQDEQYCISDEIKKLVEGLRVLMEEEKSYLNSELTIGSIAKKLDISKKELSVILNRHLDNNFSDYVNKYRVEEAKHKLVDHKFDNIKIIYIAYDSGFNSKATFYSVFKKFTGMTPSDYRIKRKN